MTAALIITRAGPAMSLQDMGRAGHLGQGLSRGGAADPLALAEGQALLGQTPDTAAIEMAGMGGVFTVTAPCRIALTGAPMLAMLDGVALRWNAAHLMPAGAELRIGGARAGAYGYLHVAGGIDAPMIMGARSAHLSGGLGALLQSGDRLALGRDQGNLAAVGRGLDVADRFAGGELRILASLQTEDFSAAERDRFTNTEFRRDARANRMGMKLTHDGAPFATAAQLDVLSEVIVPGDVQMTGAGLPFVLLPECQTTGGYPRIGTVLPCDMPRAAQAGAGARLRFRFVSRADALLAEQTYRAHLAGLRAAVRPLLRDPAQMGDLLSYQLIDGAVSAHHEGD